MKVPVCRWLPLVLLLNVLCGCGNSLNHCWFYSYGSGPGPDTTGGLTPASFIELRPDGTFTLDFGKKIDYLDVRSTPTAIKIYGNCFGLKPVDELPPRWTSLFYDSADCRKANDIIQDIFRHKTIAWANTDSKYKMFIGAFQQLEQYLTP